MGFMRQMKSAGEMIPPGFLYLKENVYYTCERKVTRFTWEFASPSFFLRR